MADKNYWALNHGDELAASVNERMQNYRDEIDKNGRWNLWQKAYRAFHSLNQFDVHEASRIFRAGEQNELSLLKANHYRNLLTHLHILTTQNRPSFECRAINTDYKSQLQTILGVNILEYYLKEKRLEEHYRLCAEYCLNYGEAYLTIEWDSEKGEPAGADIETGALLRTGDISANVYGPAHVARRCRADSDTQFDWYVVEKWISRYDLAAKYPEYADRILNYSSSQAKMDTYLFGSYFTEDDDDLIPILIFYHDRTPACPSGRYAKCLGAEITLEESTLDALGYKRLPVYRMAAYNQHGTSFGYTVGFDLLAPQEAIDIMYSTVLSNQSTFGVQNIWVPPGSSLMPSQLAGGLNILESEQKPEPINLTYTPPEIFKFMQGLETLMEMISGVNSVARGQPEASLKSGSALALVASQAVQFANSISAAYVRLLEDSGTGIITMLQNRAVLPRETIVAGKNNKNYMKEFTNEDLQAINRVVVEVGNPVSRTLAGRIQMAQDLLQSQQITPQEYLQVATTGKLEAAIEDKQSEQLLIRAENEDLREGKVVSALAVDKHLDHILGHKSVLSDSETRRQPELVQRVLDHIQEHIQALRSVDPALLNILGMAPIAPGTPPQGANAPQPPQNQPADEQAVAPPNASPDLQQAMPNMPSLPQNTPAEVAQNYQPNPQV